MQALSPFSVGAPTGEPGLELTDLSLQGIEVETSKLGD